jgi:hypothetical protein
MGTRAETDAGILGGIGVANLHQTPSRFLLYDYHSTTRLAAGGLVELSGRGRWAVRLEPMYAGKGSRFLDPRCPCLRPVGYVPKQNDLRLSYLELPLLVAFSLGRGRARPYVLAGETVSHLASARRRRDGHEIDLKPQLSKWDLGVDLGGGCRFATGRASPFVEIRYRFGLISIDDSSSHNRGAQILAGLTYEVSHH